ncbi:auxin-responsive protein SAUR64-like [Rutidosis leptorrhynchoides]|uniref:auxin-responsive protein SAUR64-like n=1 Tax=Rutidosis leptorrhynchoides TaxID=125765 RepID=UPI003A9970FD
MMTARKLVKMARKWQKEASKGGCCNDKMANKGHFVVYTSDKNRFVIPLRYLNTNIFRELLRISEDEFGLPNNGPITLFCDSSLMTYLINIVDRGLTKELEKALLVSIATSNRCSIDHGSETNNNHMKPHIAKCTQNVNERITSWHPKSRTVD